MGEVTKQRKSALAEKQLDTLKLLFRFRFGTAELIARAQGKASLQSVRNRLNTMLKKDLVIQKHDGKDRLQGKPAVYRLGTKGRAVLRHIGGGKYSESVLSAIRSNRDSSDRFIERNLDIFRIYNDLNLRYGNELVFLTKSNLATDKFNFMPEVRPDALLNLDSTDTPFFLYVLDDAVPDFSHIRKLSNIFEYEKIGKWEAETEQSFPVVLVACPSNRIETIMRKKLFRMAEDKASDIRFATSTLARLREGDKSHPWRDFEDVNHPLEAL